jgi:hypothetical protein
MILVVDMRPIATLYIGVYGMATARAFRSDTEVRISLIYIGIVVVVRHVNL